MNFLSEHFFKILLLIILIVGGNYFYKQHQEKTQWQETVSSYRDTLAEVSEATNADSDASQGNYWRFLMLVREYQENVARGEEKPLPPTKEASSNEAPSPAKQLDWFLAGIIANESNDGFTPEQQIKMDAIKTHLQTLDRLGVFEDQQNRQAMIKRNAPVARKGSFAGERLVLSHMIPPTIAPEAVHRIANYLIIPENAAALDAPEVDQRMKEYGAKLKSAGLIETETHERLQRLASDTRK
jgi:hypothetical protein